MLEHDHGEVQNRRNPTWAVDLCLSSSSSVDDMILVTVIFKGEEKTE